MSRFFATAFAALTVLSSLARAQEPNGLLADIVTSSGDNFTIELRYDAAPRTVAHFMRLASGEQPWLDHASGNIRNGVPYYTHSNFQKFASQSGPNRVWLQVGEKKDALGTEGPGYVTRDEIRRLFNGNGALILPHSAYTVTMVNTGPHSNGGQFLITLVNDPEFDDKNSAFGVVRPLYYTYSNGQAISVSNGRAAVDNIFGNFLTIGIDSITIRRRGAAAVAFDETQFSDEIPLIEKEPITSLTHAPTEAILHHPTQAGGFYRAYGSLNLITWGYSPLFDIYHGAGVGASSTMPFTHSGAEKAFFRMIGVKYPVITAPQNLNGKIVTVGVSTPHAIRFEFGANGLSAAYYRYSDQTVGALIYDYKVTGPYSAELHVTSPGIDEATYTLYFGGKDTAVSTNQVMGAEIQYVGFTVFGSHFTLLP